MPDSIRSGAEPLKAADDVRSIDFYEAVLVLDAIHPAKHAMLGATLRWTGCIASSWTSRESNVSCKLAAGGGWKVHSIPPDGSFVPPCPYVRSISGRLELLLKITRFKLKDRARTPRRVDVLQRLIRREPDPRDDVPIPATEGRFLLPFVVV